MEDHCSISGSGHLQNTVLASLSINSIWRREGALGRIVSFIYRLISAFEDAELAQLPENSLIDKTVR